MGAIFHCNDFSCLSPHSLCVDFIIRLSEDNPFSQVCPTFLLMWQTLPERSIFPQIPPLAFSQRSDPSFPLPQLKWPAMCAWSPNPPSALTSTTSLLWTNIVNLWIHLPAYPTNSARSMWPKLMALPPTSPICLVIPQWVSSARPKSQETDKEQK